MKYITFSSSWAATVSLAATQTSPFFQAGSYSHLASSLLLMGTKVFFVRTLAAAQVAYLTGNIAVQYLLGSPQALVLLVSIPREGLLHCKLQL